MRSMVLRLLVGGASLAAVVACSSGGSSETRDEADAGRKLDTKGALVAPFVCKTDGIYGEPRPGRDLLERLRAAAALDVLEERVVAEAGLDAGTAGSVRAGTPCASATDRATCESAFAQLSSGGEALRPTFDEGDFVKAVLSGSKSGPPGYYLAHTKGDAVGKVSNRTELRSLFPTVDTPAVALLYANAAGYRVECQHADGWLREEPDGWVLLASRGHEARCYRSDVVLFLRRDGTTEERDAIEHQADSCI